MSSQSSSSIHRPTISDLMSFLNQEWSVLVITLLLIFIVLI